MGQSVRDLLALTGVALVVSLLGPSAFPQAPQATGLKVEVMEGEGAINSISERRAREPVVRVLDDNNRPVAGATVSFVTPDLGASAMFPSGSTIAVTTGPDGVAAGRGLRPNNIAGEFQIRVTASFQGRTATAAITQTNAAPAAARRGNGLAIALVAIIGGGAAAGAAVALGGKGGTTSPTPTPTPTPTPRPATTVTPGGGSFGPP